MDAKSPFPAYSDLIAKAPAQAFSSKDQVLDDEEVPYLLRLAHQSAMAALQSRLDGSGLTIPQFFALNRLSLSGPLSQNELGRQAGMDPATIQGVTQRLLTRGLIQRQPDVKDKRRLILSLTDDGGRTLSQVASAKAGAARETLRHLHVEERQALSRALKKIAGV